MASAIWSRKDPRFPGLHRLGVSPSFDIYYKCGIMLVLKGWCSPCTAVIQYSNISNGLSFSSRPVLSCIRTWDFRNKFASPNPRIAFLALEASVVLSGRVLPEHSCS